MHRLSWGCFALIVLATSRTQADEVRPAAVSGTFYERAPFALDTQVNTLLAGAGQSDTTGPLVAAVVPHAGYVFSGRCAASVYSLVASGMFERVIILAPGHHAYLTGVSLPAPDLLAYATPLGKVQIDRGVCNALRACNGFATVPGADTREHAVEVHLPLLQKTARDFKLVPLICGHMDDAQVDAVAKVLAGYLGSNTLLIASSDFTHYGQNYGFVPFSSRIPEQLQAWLDEAAGRIAAMDGAGFVRHCQQTRDTICGETPIRILLAALVHSGLNVTGHVLKTATSGGLTGNYDNSVSYAAIAFFCRGPMAADAGSKVGPLAGAVGKGQKAVRQEGANVKEHRSGDWTPGLTDAEKRTLFAIARDTLKWCVNGGKGKFSFEAYDITPLMKVNTATFVTLKIQGGLRGCIGSLAPVEPLYLSVHDNAVNAALRDPRFEPVRPAELGRIEVDVSILSPIRDIPSLKDFKIGQHGIILEKGMSRAVYLPEVATEQGWTVEDTLSSLSMKAGLPPDAWRRGATFKVFESVVLSE
jgi:AmmeMemoRadiSam system protein B/AmmeMemoRadiSam system protein A